MMTQKYKTCAIIVTYNPSHDFESNLKEISKVADHVVVVDNNSTDKWPLSTCSEIKNLTLIENRYNLGIATALNSGVRKAFELGYDWVITMDQDTFISCEAIAKMFEAYELIEDKSDIGLLAPVHYDKKTGYQSRFIRGIRGPYTPREIVMSSGNLIPRSTFEKVGYYDDDLFIEYVDHDFCLRIKKKGLKIILVKDAQMGHSLGNIKVHKLGPLFFFSHNYLAARRYYRARNRIVLYRRFFGLWIFQDQEFAVKDMFKILLVEDKKWQKIKATWLGTLDGLLARMGSFDGATHDTPKASKYFVEFREEIVPLLPEGQIDRLLDLGCGSGETSGYLKATQKVKWACGVEGSPEAAAVARKKLDKIIEGDIERVEFDIELKSVNVILALDILEHLVDPWTVINRLKNLLSSHGSIVVSIPNVRHYSILFPLIFLGDWRYTQEGLLDSTHIRFFTKSTVIQMFEKQGFKLEKYDFTGAKRGVIYWFNKFTFNIFREFFVFQNLYRFNKVD